MRRFISLLSVMLVPACDDEALLDDPRDALLAVDGMLSVEERPVSPEGYRVYELIFEQPVDHGDPDGPRFGQRITLAHRDFGVPMVLASTGYHDYLGAFLGEPAMLFGAGQLMVEHRYFDDSRPVPVSWEHLTIEQAAADHHRVIEALAPLYPGPWISTGASKGGMTSVYHRRFHPGDVVATVAYVTPNSLGAPDERYASFFDTVGDSAGQSACRERVRALQRDALGRRASLEELARSYASALGLSFERVGGIEAAVEESIEGFEWAFWQYMGAGWCDAIPDSTATDSEYFNMLTRAGVMDGSSDAFIELFEPYYYQVYTQLGYPLVPIAHIDDLLIHDVAAEMLLPEGVTAEHDPAAMLDVAAWVSAEASEILFVYGEYDPWTAGAFDVQGNERVRAFVAGAGTHEVTLADLDPAAQSEALALLGAWTGVQPAGLAPRSVPAPRLVPHRVRAAGVSSMY